MQTDAGESASLRATSWPGGAIWPDQLNLAAQTFIAPIGCDATCRQNSEDRQNWRHVAGRPRQGRGTGAVA